MKKKKHCDVNTIKICSKLCKMLQVYNITWWNTFEKCSFLKCHKI